MDPGAGRAALGFPGLGAVPAPAPGGGNRAGHPLGPHPQGRWLALRIDLCGMGAAPAAQARQRLIPDGSGSQGARRVGRCGGIGSRLHRERPVVRPAWRPAPARLSCKIGSRAADHVYCPRMTEKILALLAHFIIATISASGYLGVALLMGIESACIPLPSEIIMPFAGYLVHGGQLTLIGVATAGAIGCNLGSAVAYWIGAWGGRPFIEKYGRFVLLDHRDLDRAEHFFSRFGSITVFVGRLLPVIRTFIALPAGVARMSHLQFHIYTF